MIRKLKINKTMLIMCFIPVVWYLSSLGSFTRFCAHLINTVGGTAHMETEHGGRNDNREMEVNIPNLSKQESIRFSSDGSYLLENRNLCENVSNLTVLVMVLSSATHFQNRNALRKTWANVTYYSTYGKVRVVFLLGVNEDESIQKKIKEEYNKYGDIVQGSFLDTYFNLARKSMMGYKWAMERCKNAKYIMKSDDDIVVNMFKLFQNNAFVNTYDVYCLRIHNGKIARNKKSKSYVKPGILKGQSVYPPYCRGQLVLMLNNVSRYIYEAALHTPPFWIDDVYMYVMVLGKILRINFKPIEEGEYGDDFTWSVDCLIRKKRDCQHVYSVTTKSEEILDLWSLIVDLYQV